MSQPCGEVCEARQIRYSQILENMESRENPAMKLRSYATRDSSKCSTCDCHEIVIDRLAEDGWDLLRHQL